MTTHLPNPKTALAVLLLLTLAPAGRAQTYTWNRDANDTWNLAGNWSPSAIPNGQAVSAVLAGVITADRAISLDGGVSVGSLTLQSTTHSYSLNGSQTLTFDNGASAAVLSVATSATA